MNFNINWYKEKKISSVDEFVGANFTYLKLTIPHVALVGFVCFYATIGAWIFYAIESPHEDRIKQDGVNRLAILKWELIDSLWNNSLTEGRQMWMMNMGENLDRFNDQLYRAFKQEFVRYSDLRLGRRRRRKNRRRRSRRNKNVKVTKQMKLWTANSAIFFAATTMTTIGYGNIVPVTFNGRLVCVLFALFGVPLAIITIGDVGKFLSECTILLHGKCVKIGANIRQFVRRFRFCKTIMSSHDLDAKVAMTIGQMPGGGNIGDDSTLDWQNLEMDKTQVPVLMVFAILLLYIAFGALLFSFLEKWTYMNSFYYCFITLTTIGFGDLVPEQHQYMLLMLLYIGVGLAVATMCIDLVGIQYIQKIHYFGRKFQHTDLLQLLRRRRLIERRLAMGQGQQLLDLYKEHISRQRSEEELNELHPIIGVEEQREHFKLSVSVQDEQEWQRTASAENEEDYDPRISIEDEEECDCECVENEKDTPSSAASLKSPSLISLASSFAIRAFMYHRRQYRTSSWTDSGPDPSFHCSLSTSPSYEQRLTMYTLKMDQDSDFGRSISSFLFDFPPSPYVDLKEIADTVRSRTRHLSCPSVLDFVLPELSPIGIACMEQWDSFMEMLNEYEKPYVRRYDPPGVTVELATSFESDDQTIQALASLTPSTDSSLDLGAFELADPTTAGPTSRTPVLYHVDLPVHSVHNDTVQTAVALIDLMNAPSSLLGDRLPDTVVDDNYCFVIDGDQIDLHQMASDERWWKHTSRPVKHYCSDDGCTYTKVNIIVAKGRPISARLAGRSADVFTTTVDSRSNWLNTSSESFAKSPSSSSSSSVHFDDTKLSQSFAEPSRLPADGAGYIHRADSVSHRRKQSSGSSRQLSLPQRSATLRADHGDDHVSLDRVFKVTRCYSFWKTCTAFHRIVTSIEGVQSNSPFRRRLFVQYLWRSAKPAEKERVRREFAKSKQKLDDFVQPTPSSKGRQ